ncbi:MAG: hypothetical protein V4692_14320, partial [Bdellovibrionota bacterium]
REKLLARLFRTDRFRNIEEALEDSSRHLAEQISSRRRNLESLLASLEVETPEMLASKLDEMSVRLEEIKKLEPEIKNNFESTSLKLDVAREARRNFEELSVAQAHQIEIEKARPDFIRKSKKIEDEKRARPVLVLHSRLVTLVSDLDRVSKELASTRDSQATTEKSFKSTDDEFNKLSGVKIEIEKARGDRDRLKEVYAGAKKLGETRERLSALMKSHADLEREVSVVDTESLDQALAVVLSKTASSAMLLSLSSEKIERAEIELKKNQLRYHLSEASRLATQLEDGKPCAVCGSKTHPKPAT